MPSQGEVTTLSYSARRCDRNRGGVKRVGTQARESATVRRDTKTNVTATTGQRIADAACGPPVTRGQRRPACCSNSCSCDAAPSCPSLRGGCVCEAAVVRRSQLLWRDWLRRAGVAALRWPVWLRVARLWAAWLQLAEARCWRGGHTSDRGRAQRDRRGGLRRGSKHARAGDGCGVCEHAELWIVHAR